MAADAGFDNVLPEAVRPPRRNGELIFEAPWQSTVFGMVVALNQSGHLDWASFGERSAAPLPDRVAGATVDVGEVTARYAAWLDAVEAELVASGVVTVDDLHDVALRQRRHDRHGRV